MARMKYRVRSSMGYEWRKDMSKRRTSRGIMVPHIQKINITRENCKHLQGCDTGKGPRRDLETGGILRWMNQGLEDK